MFCFCFFTVNQFFVREKVALKEAEEAEKRARGEVMRLKQAKERGNQEREKQQEEIQVTRLKAFVSKYIHIHSTYIYNNNLC